MQGDPSQGGPITFREDSMISQIDIDAWAEDFNSILEDLPFEERKLKYKVNMRERGRERETCHILLFCCVSIQV